MINNKTMRSINVYLNFDGKTEEAFKFYQSVFGGEITLLQRMKDAPGTENLSAEEQNRIMHVSLPIAEGYILMATDILPSAGHKLVEGNNYHITFGPESEDDAIKIFNKLADGGTITMPIEKMFWGALYGSCTDKFGINWMVNYQIP
jgi:PhnB protein